MTHSSHTPPLEGVVRQHAEDAAFDWLLRDDAVVDPAFYLDEIDALDDRIEAHLDGLRIAGEAGREAARTQLAEQEAGEVFVAAALALEGDRTSDLAAAREVAEADADAARGLVSALAWQPRERALPVIRDLLAGSPQSRRVALRAAAAHALPLHEELREALHADDAPLRAAAVRGVGELGRVDLVPSLSEQVASDEPEVRFWAAWSLALLGVDADPLLEIASGESPRAESALALALRRVTPPLARAWIEARQDDPTQRRRAVLGAGAAGDPLHVPWLIECMADPDLARVAGESFATIAGADIDEDHLDGDAPEEDPDSDDAPEDPDSAFEWPDRDRAAQWWSERRDGFAQGTRTLWGAPIDAAGVRRALCEGRQTVRIAAALELARLEPGAPLFRARALAARQREWLGLTG